MTLDAVAVFADIGPGDPLVMGELRHQGRGRGSVFSFLYDKMWLGRADAFVFDPELQLVTGPQYPAAGRPNFGIFLDSCPDRWGRLLIQRREQRRARREGRASRSLTDWDYLLGVNDETRLGALRFRALEGGSFLDHDHALAAPPLASLRELLDASLALEQYGADDDHPEIDRWLAQLYAPGTSLGGARPKASVRDESGALCVAKFPSRTDYRDVGAWELVAQRLAARAGVRVPVTRALRIPGSEHTTFLARRFDRFATGKRIAFASAITLTQRTYGEPGASYVELVELLQSYGANTREDCVELFRRVLLSILIHNVDDHLRNHGFFLAAKGITLAPAYDINPSIEGDDLTLAINEVDTGCDVSIAMDASAIYGLKKPEADKVLDEVRGAVAYWREEAQQLGIARAEQDRMAPSFQVT